MWWESAMGQDRGGGRSEAEAMLDRVAGARRVGGAAPLPRRLLLACANPDWRRGVLTHVLVSNRHLLAQALRGRDHGQAGPPEDAAWGERVERGGGGKCHHGGRREAEERVGRHRFQRWAARRGGRVGQG